jgi:hypothetical protein
VPPQQQQQQPAASSKKRQASIFDFMASKASKKPAAVTADAEGGGSGSGLGSVQEQGEKRSGKLVVGHAGGDSQSSGGGVGAGEVMGLQPSEVAQLLSNASRRLVLLVQRPEEGLLAGLWELPGRWQLWWWALLSGC